MLNGDLSLLHGGNSKITWGSGDTESSSLYYKKAQTCVHSRRLSHFASKSAEVCECDLQVGWSKQSHNDVSRFSQKIPLIQLSSNLVLEHRAYATSRTNQLCKILTHFVQGF